MSSSKAPPQPPAAAPKGERSHFGGDDWLTRYPPGHRPAFRIDCTFPKPGWRARQEASTRNVLHPGTAILLEDQLLEVVAYKPSRHSPPRHLYYLVAWDDSLTPAPPEEYTPRRAEQYAESRKQAASRERLAVGLLLLAPFFSLLPAQDQERLERRHDYPAMTACRWTSAATLSLAIAGWLWTVWAVASGAVSPAVSTRLPLIALFFRLLGADSLVRLAASMATSNPVGSVFVAGPIVLCRALRQALSRETRVKSSNLARFERTHVEEWQTARDRIVPLDIDEETGRPFLEVRSQLGKPHWTLNRIGVRYQNQWYLPIEREELATTVADEPRHRFVLEPISPQRHFTEAVDYDPSEVGALLYRHLQEKRATWVQTFGLFLGLLEEEEKRKLERLYGFDVERQTRVSLLWQVGISVVVLWWASSRVSLGESLLSHGIELALGGFALFESFQRYSRIRAGRSPGSLFGIPVRVLAKPLFDFPERTAPHSHDEVSWQGSPDEPSDPFDRPIR